MTSLTGISQGFDNCTKATLQSNYFWETPPDDCFCLENDHDIIIIKRAESYFGLFPILIWRSSTKINRNKNLLILYNSWKKLSKFSIAQKKVLHASVSFQLCSTANSKFSLYVVSFCEINCIKIQTVSLVSKSIYFSRDYRDSFCFIYFHVNIRQRLKKKIKLV